MQLDDMGICDIFNVLITGKDSQSYNTYSQKGQKTYITIPDKEVLNKIKKVINKIESGKELTEKDIEGLN